MGAGFSFFSCLDDKMEQRAVAAEALAAEMHHALLLANERATLAEQAAATARRELEATMAKLAAAEATLITNDRPAAPPSRGGALRGGGARVLDIVESTAVAPPASMQATEHGLLERLAAVRQAVAQPRKPDARPADAEAATAALLHAEEEAQAGEVEAWRREREEPEEQEGSLSPTAAAFKTRVRLQRTPVHPRSKQHLQKTREPLMESNRS
ncbi:hypothetical protein AB1Y20_018043 [Prymnesium parvum]|uniref:Uncharacterized protein n=1 Tax=Prymnesium parvum TaxID=97485 RepID=A0AB34JMY4_PRYPA